MIRPLIGVVAALAFSLASVAANGVELQPKPKAGTQVHYLMTSRHAETQKYAAAPDEPLQEMKLTRTSEAGMELRCREVKADGSAVFEWTLMYVALAGEGDMPMDYDSRDPAHRDSPIGYMFEQLLNQPATVTVDASGKVTDYKDPASVGGGPIRYFMESLLSKEAFQRLGLVAMAGAPVDAGVGATWSVTEPVDLSEGLGTMLVTSHYQFQEIKEGGKTAEIAVQGTLSMKKPESAPDAASATQPSMVIDQGETSGKSLWDCAAGQLLSSEARTMLVATATGSFGKVDFQQTATTQVKRTTLEEFHRALKKPTPTSQPAAETQPG